MIKNIVFDLGQVLVQFIPEIFIKRLNLNNAEDEKTLYEEVFHSEEWPKTDSGELSEQQACKLVCQRLEKRLHPYVRSLFLDWYKPILYVEGMMELTAELKKNGYHLYLLSNAGLLQNDYWPKMSCYNDFSGKITSAEEHLVKPNAQIYQRLFECYGLKPEESIFIDDSIKNCEGSIQCGMQAILFHNCPQLRKELRNCGVQCHE